MRTIRLITLLTFKEIIRNRNYGFIVVFSIVTTASLQLFSNFTSQEQDKFFKDVGFAAIVFFSLLLGAVLGSTQIRNDFDSKNILSVFTNPVTPFSYLVGRFTGVALLIGASFLMLELVFYLNLILQKIIFLSKQENLSLSFLSTFVISFKAVCVENFALFKVFAATFLQSLIVCSMALFFATLISIPLALGVTLIIFFLGHLIEFISQIAAQFHVVLGYFFRIIFIWIPNFENYNIADMAALGHDISMIHFCALILYTAIFCSMFLLMTYQAMKFKVSDL